MVDFGRPAGDMYKSVYDANDDGVVDEVAALQDHASDHQDGGDDEISVAALSGELADAQPVKAHDLAGGRHNAAILANLNTLISDATLDKDSDTRTPAAHKTSHQNGGTDEISVAGLDGKSLFVDRGDAAAWDWEIGDLTTDATWRDLDCHLIVPAGATWIKFHILITDDLTNISFLLRKKGYTNGIIDTHLITQVTNISVAQDCLVPCDSNRFVQYYATSLTWTRISVVVTGWII